MPSSQDTYTDRIPETYAGRVATGTPNLISIYRAAGTIPPGVAVRRSSNSRACVVGVGVGGSSPYNVTGFLGVSGVKTRASADQWVANDMVRVYYQGDIDVVISDASSSSKTPRPGDYAQIVAADGTFRRGGTAAATLGVTGAAAGLIVMFVSGLRSAGDGKTVATVRLNGTQL